MHGRECVLVVEAASGRRDSLVSVLRGAGMETETAQTASEATRKLALWQRFAGAVVAADLPDAKGPALICGLRAQGVRLPLLLVSAPLDDDAIVKALQSGADDVVTYPLHPALFLARLRAQLRGFASSEDSSIQLGPFRLDARTRMLIGPCGRRRARLTETELAVLRQLHSAGGARVDHGALMRNVWGYSPDARSHTLATHVYRLRRKLQMGDEAPQLAIHCDTKGYRLEISMLPDAGPPAARGAAVPAAAFRL